DEREPREILTCANAILGFGQASLAKYLFIAAHEDDPSLDVNDVEAFFRHLLARVDFRRDLHFQTRTTIDTLDYSGAGLNAGSKLVLAAAGSVKRDLSRTAPPGLGLIALPGVLVIEADAFPGYPRVAAEMEALSRRLASRDLAGFPLVVLVDDPEFTTATLRNFLWVTFTRSNPSHDVHGVASFIEHKHWGCEGPLLIDARLKPHHAPPLLEDPEVTKRVDALAAKGKSLHGVI
ncbi:MAG TPA: 3-octaprenyl-4-hydroxybenzoate carboxy-lyase, partial [Vicinamibacteria bacterium]